MNPNQLKKLMKAMKPEEMEVEELVFKMSDGTKKVMVQPSVTKINMMGQEVYQVNGELEDLEEDNQPNINQEDIQMVAQKANVSEEEAKKALEESEGDLAQAILSLQ